MPEPIISVSGLRGVIGSSLTPEVALRYAAAFASQVPPGPIVVTRDGRDSGQMLAAAITAGLKAAGRDVINGGIAATPTTGVLVRELRAAGGIQISASHNPAEYNGMKLFSAAGRVIPAADGQRVLEHYRAGQPAWAAHDELGTAYSDPSASARHLELVLGRVDVERIRARGFRVLLDANHGAGSVLGRRLLAELGCDVIELGGQPDGRFEHEPEPTAANLAGVLPRVVAARAAVGFCQDPDADRLALIDETGRYIGEEYTLALAVDHVLRGARGPLWRRGPIVTNCSTSRMSEDLAKKYGVPFFRSAVGEANVVDRMLTEGAVLGGEGNGGVIDPEVVLVRDSLVGMAIVLDALAAARLPLSQLAAELPRYEIVKAKATIDPAQVPARLEALARHFAAAEVDRLDGLRLDWPGKWLLVRASNTEPIVRAIAEAGSAAEAQRLCDEACAVLSG